jgi:methionyl-tRNA synthetase
VGLGTDSERFERWWPADLHVIGKDITRFHAVIWPAMLMAANLPLPRQIFGHGFMTKDGQRMSKSNPGTIIDPIEAAGRLGVDPLRLYLTKEIVFGSDGDFSWGRFEEKYNVDLANNLGNLVSRVTTMAERFRGGRLTAAVASNRLADMTVSTHTAYVESMDRLALDDACQRVFRLIDATNEYIAASEPWVLAKQERGRELDEVLWTTAESLRIAAVLLSPVMPGSCDRILSRLDARARTGSDLRLDRDAVLATSGERSVTNGPPLWPRLEPSDGAVTVTAPSKEKTVSDSVPQPNVPPPGPAAPASSLPTAPPAGAAPSAPAAPASDTRLSIDEFMKIDLRVARVLTAERVPNSKKLMKLTVDLGTEQRTIVAGIAEAYEADALVGRTIAIVANLKPAKLMGVESNGMVLAASAEGGKPLLVSFEQAPPPGTRIR